MPTEDWYKNTTPVSSVIETGVFLFAKSKFYGILCVVPGRIVALAFGQVRKVRTPTSSQEELKM